MAASIFVLERQPYWTPELQRQFLASDIQVRGYQKWSELAAAVRSAPPALAVIQFDDFAAECLTGLAARNIDPQSIPLIVLSSPRLASFEYPLRDAGVAMFFPDLPTGDQLAKCCRRWLA